MPSKSSLSGRTADAGLLPNLRPGQSSLTQLFQLRYIHIDPWTIYGGPFTTGMLKARHRRSGALPTSRQGRLPSDGWP